ncbi:hypothetical protein SHIRM173S_11306 [Streptomyces hirsutus]
MPGSPAVRVAACSPLSMPWPAGSQPMSRTEASGMKAWKRPMALEPPPTQAMAASGSRPARSRSLAAGLDADDAVEVAHHAGEGVGSGDGAEEVVRAVDVGDPVAERLVDGVLEGAAAGLHGDDLGAEHAHPGHVEGLALGVDLAHVDGAVEAEQGAGGGGGDAVLAGAGLGDDTGLAHAPGEQGLAEHVVDLVGAGVVEVLALEEDPGTAGVFGEPGHLGEGTRAAGVVDQQVVEFAGELGVGLGLVVLDGDLVHRGDERLRDELAAERAEVALGAGDPALGVGQEELAGHAETSR